MADLKISQLTALAGASVVATDVLPIVDVSETTTKKITASELSGYVVSGLGTYTTYTPTLSGVTLGNATVDARYTQIGKLVHYYGIITFGSTTTITGSNWEISLPVNTGGATVFPIPCGGASYYDASSGLLHWGETVRFFNATSLRLTIDLAAQTYTTSLSSTLPFTWATSDQLAFNVTYQAA
jgi:hypothetical protein